MTSSSTNRFIVIDGYSAGKAKTKAVFLSKKEAVAYCAGSAVGYMYWIFDTSRACGLDPRGRKWTSSNMFVQNLSWAWKNQQHVPGSEVIGIDDPNITPPWMLDRQAMIARYQESDDIFTEFDASSHAEVVRTAVILGKPVPASVLADFPPDA